MTVSETDLEALVVGTSQLAGLLDVSTTYIADLTRSGVLEPLRKPNGTAVRGRYPLVAAVAAFSGKAVHATISVKFRCPGVGQGGL